MSEIAEKKTPVYDGKDFEKEVRRFAESIDSLLMSLPSVMATMQTEVKKQNAEFKKFLKVSGAERTVTGRTIRFTLKGGDVSTVLKMQRQLHNNETAYCQVGGIADTLTQTNGHFYRVFCQNRVAQVTVLSV